MVSFSAPPLSEKLKPFSEIMDKSRPRPASARISWNGEIGGSLSLTRGFPVPDPPEPAFRGRGTLFAKNGACRNVSCIIVFQVFIPAKLALKERGPASPYFFRPFSVCSRPSGLEEWGRFDQSDPIRSGGQIWGSDLGVRPIVAAGEQSKIARVATIEQEILQGSRPVCTLRPSFTR